jgi:hypothetical protein
MDKNKRKQVTLALQGCFADDEIPDEFEFNGQNFIERCEGWALHALEQLEDELQAERGDAIADMETQS